MVLAFGKAQAASFESLLSPNGKIKVDVCIGDSLQFSVSKGNECIVNSCAISLQFTQKQMGVNPKLKGTKRDFIDEILHNKIPIKNAVTHNMASRLIMMWNSALTTMPLLTVLLPEGKV